MGYWIDDGWTGFLIRLNTPLGGYDVGSILSVTGDDISLAWDLWFPGNASILRVRDGGVRWSSDAGRGKWKSPRPGVIDILMPVWDHVHSRGDVVKCKDWRGARCSCTQPA